MTSTIPFWESCARSARRSRASDHEVVMEYNLKTISQAGIDEANRKAERYRFLNQPQEAESICRDVLVTDPENQLALRELGLAITDQFTGHMADRPGEAEK